jgi:hypothetical protein
MDQTLLGIIIANSFDSNGRRDSLQGWNDRHSRRYVISKSGCRQGQATKRKKAQIGRPSNDLIGQRMISRKRLSTRISGKSLTWAC